MLKELYLTDRSYMAVLYSRFVETLDLSSGSLGNDQGSPKVDDNLCQVWTVI